MHGQASTVLSSLMVRSRRKREEEEEEREHRGGALQRVIVPHTSLFCLSPCVCLRVCVFACLGQTGAGKSYSMVCVIVSE